MHDEMGGSRAEGAKTIKGNAVQAGNVPSASDIMKTDCVTDRGQSGQADEKQMNDGMGASRTEGAKTIKGEMLRVEGENYFIKGDLNGFPAE